MGSNNCDQMSKATKRKHVTKEVLEEYASPVGNQSIVKVEKEYQSIDECLISHDLTARWSVDEVTTCTRWKPWTENPTLYQCPLNSEEMCG